MFKPARMTRVLLGGHKARMEEVIQVLHREGVVHLEDYKDPTGTTSIGTPLEAGDQASQLLLRVRGLLKAIDAEGGSKEMATGDPEALVADAEAELTPIIQEAAKLRTDIGAMEAEMAHLEPFAGIDADLAVLQQLRSVQPYMGLVKSDPRADLDAADVQYDAGVEGNAVIIVVAADDAEKADRILGTHGFSSVAIPEDAEGTPARRIDHLNGRVARDQERLDRAEQRIAGHREQWGPRLAALENHLAALVEKTQAPLSFGVTETTFHIEGWVPVDRVNRVQNAINGRFGDNVYFETLGDVPETAHPGPEDEAPVKLQNKGLAKPYEFMLGLLGKPRYNEIDPTKLMLIFFPLFFGLMVGDVLVGLVIMLVGFYLKKNHIFGIGGPAVGRALAMGGFMAVLVGAFIFGEALGMHFVVSDEALDEGEHSWEEIIYGSHVNDEGHRVLNAEFPSEGFFHKEVSHHDTGHGVDDGHTDGDPDGNATDGNATHGNATDGNATDDQNMTLMAEAAEESGGLTAILAPHGEVHMKAGPVQLGFYSKIHDIQALLAWCLVIAVIHLNLAFLLGIRNVAVGHGVTLAIQEKLSWITAQIGLALAVWGWAFIQSNAILAIGLGIFVASIALLWKGVEKALGAPGFVAILEFLGFFGNILSYTRLAAIGASKAGMALAFAAIGFDVLGGGDVQSPVGWIVYGLGMVLITALAMLSGGLQSLRLQFVEFFGKFYEGGGRPFKPFGRTP